MKSFDFTIDRAFINGQHTETIGARNRDVLTTCKNMRPTEFGAAFLKSIGQNIVSPPTTNWPYPNLFKGKTVTLLADDQAIYSINESTGVKTAITAYTVASANNPTTESVTDGDMSASTYWTEGAGHSVTGGKLVLTAAADETETGQANGDQASAIVAGRLYRCTFTIDSISSGGVRIEIGGTVGTTRTAAGTYTEDIIATSSSDIVFAAVGVTTATIDNASVKRIVEATIPAGGGAWHFCEFRGVWFLFKEGCVIAKLPYYSDFRAICITESADDFTCNTGENLQNRLFLGGITAETLLATTDWQDAWSAWVENSSDWSDEMTFEDMALTSNMVMYSTRVGGDVYWPFITEMAMLGFPHLDTATVKAELKSNYLDWIRKGEIGFVPLQHQGAVKKLMRLGPSIVAYCTDGVSIITPREDKGYRAQVVHNAGIASRSAVSGDPTRHVFLDSNSILWGLTLDGGLERLCGTGTFNTMVTNESSNPIICSYDPEEQEYYICSDQDGYIRTRTGLGQITILPTSLTVWSSGLEGPVENLGVTAMEIETETFDMGMKALKTLHTIQIGYTDIANLKVVVRYKYDATTTWKESSEYTVSGDSVAVPIFTASDFRLKFTGTPGSNAQIDYVNITYQVSDKRNIRAQYA